MGLQGVQDYRRELERQHEALDVVLETLSPEGLDELLGHEVQKRGVLSDAYAALRREHITALVRLHRAHQAVARAAVTYQDPKLAALARDELRGLPKAQAEQQIPRTAEVLKKAGL